MQHRHEQGALNSREMLSSEDGEGSGANAQPL